MNFDTTTIALFAIAIVRRLLPLSSFNILPIVNKDDYPSSLGSEYDKGN
jgi:hypothetical protein